MNSTTATGGPVTPPLAQDLDDPIVPHGRTDLFELLSAWLEMDFPDRDGARPARRAESTTAGGTR